MRGFWSGGGKKTFPSLHRASAFVIEGYFRLKSGEKNHFSPFFASSEETSRFSKLYFDFIVITLNVEQTEKQRKWLLLKYYVVVMTV